jgi:hypothetical protein
VDAESLMQRIDSGDIDPSELFVGCSDVNSTLAKLLQSKGVQVSGVKATSRSVISTFEKQYSKKA